MTCDNCPAAKNFLYATKNIQYARKNVQYATKYVRYAKYNYDSLTMTET